MKKIKLDLLQHEICYLIFYRYMITKHAKNLLDRYSKWNGNEP